MIPAALHPNEELRLKALREYFILDSEAEEVFDELTELASFVCATPISLITLIDEKRQWFKSTCGLDGEETPREYAFCAHAILQEGVFIVNDADADVRFRDNPYVVEDPNVKFYAGAVLKSADNFPLGTLCVVDHHPRDFSRQEARALEIIARQVESQLELRRDNLVLRELNKTRRNVMSLVAHDLKGAFTGVLGFSKILAKKLDAPETAKDLQNLGNHLMTSASDVFKLLDELLQWTEFQMGQAEPNLQSFQVKDIIVDCLELFHDIAKTKEITLYTKLPESVLVYADSAITKTVLRNFLSNAIKYSPRESKVEIGLSLKDDYAVLWVQDYGDGIPEAIKETLFKTALPSEPGTEDELGHGIGLTLCKGIAQKQNSRIWVDTETVKGCRMCISIPLSVDNKTAENKSSTDD